MAMKSSPKPKKKKILLALMAGLVSLCLCVIVAALIAPDRETAQIAAVQQSTSTSAPVPTTTPESTATAHVTPTPTIDAEAQAKADYILKASIIMLNCNSHLSDFIDLNDKGSKDPILLYSTTWKSEMLSTLQAMQKACREMGMIVPVPPAMKPADTYMKFASVEMDLVIENYSQGIDTLEMEYITAATQHMEKVSEYVGKATEEMGK